MTASGMDFEQGSGVFTLDVCSRVTDNMKRDTAEKVSEGADGTV